MKTNFKFNCEMSGVSGSLVVLGKNKAKIEYYFWGSTVPYEFEGNIEEIIIKIPLNYRKEILSEINKSKKSIVCYLINFTKNIIF